MSTTRLPPAPEPTLLGAEVSGHVAEFYGHTDAALHAYGLAVWKAAMEAAAQACEEERPSAPGPYCPWSDEQDARYEAFTDAAKALRSLPLPELAGSPQERRE